MRQLERLFVTHLAESVNDQYKRIRLAQAEQPLRTTGLSATDIAVACRFKSCSHFSRSYRKRYGRAPSTDR